MSPNEFIAITLGLPIGLSLGYLLVTWAGSSTTNRDYNP